tara:strand:+ start:37534 stop:38583 length:1050 start_codon:yes stop_codon:yes gene_type:complete
MKSAVILANPSTGYMVGGAENQLIQLGAELSAVGKEVTVIGFIDHVPSNDPFDYRKIAGNWARPLAWLRLFQTLLELRPDVFVTRVLNPLLPIYGLICRLLGIKLYYFCAHDWELESRPDKRINGWRWRSFWLGIQFVDKLFVQNKFQLSGFKRLLWSGKSRVKIIRNIPLMRPAERMEPHDDVFIWIGSYRPHKRPEWVIEIAKALPHHNFEVVVDVKHRTKVAELFQNAAETIPNFSYMPGASREELFEVYRRAKAVLITSEGEGFPNVAIEAWSQGRSVISTVNNALLDFEQGDSVTIAEDLHAFIKAIQDTPSDDWSANGAFALKMFQQEFQTEKIIKQLLSYSA